MVLFLAGAPTPMLSLAPLPLIISFLPFLLNSLSLPNKSPAGLLTVLLFLVCAFSFSFSSFFPQSFSSSISPSYIYLFPSSLFLFIPSFPSSYLLLISPSVPFLSLSFLYLSLPFLYLFPSSLFLFIRSFPSSISPSLITVLPSPFLLSLGHFLILFFFHR